MADVEAIVRIGAGDVYNSYVTSPHKVAVPSGSKSGSTPSSSADTISVIYEPQPSDLAYLLHDPDEEVYDETPSLIPVKYIVEKLEEYGTKCIPLKVYVSALLRTWETALLLYLPFLFNKAQSEYSQTLILEISPFLLEKDEFSMVKQNSNKPLDFSGNVQEFFKFIKLLIYFIHLNNQEKGNIMGIPELYLKEIPNKFTIILIAGSQKVCLRIDVKGKKVEYYAPSNLNQNPITIPPTTLKKMREKIMIEISPPSDSNPNNKYESYNDNRLTTDPPPRTIYSTFQLWGGGINFNNFETIAKFGPHIFSFLKWVIEFKSHPKNTPILFVSHSKTMNEFLKMMICNLNYNYTADHVTSFPPTTEFVNVCKEARKTNTWSMRFKYLGYNVTGFRHAQSCDNMYKALKMKVFSSSDREKFGNYTNLSLWGIFSTLIFIHSNKGIISDFKNSEIDKSGLMILSGMGQQSKENIEKFSVENELTCGDLLTRFSPPTTKKLSGDKTSDDSLTLTFSAITNLVNTIPSSIPLQEMYTTDRQRMSNELYSLCNIFKIEFKGCDKDGCKIKVTYIGPYNFEGCLEGRSYNELRPEDKETIDALSQRKVYINIDNDNTDFILTLQNVYKGGYAIGEDGTQHIRGKVAQTFLRDKIVNIDPFKLPYRPTTTSIIDTPDKKIEISNDFQQSVGFLMGFDLINATLVTYDAAYNTNILYSNLLIRQLLNTYLLISSDKAVNWGPGTQKTIVYTNTKTFLEQGTDELYGGKNNEKRKKNNKHKNHKK